jgi:hypothetical protein
VLLERQLYYSKYDSPPGTIDFEYMSELLTHKLPIEQIKLPNDVQDHLYMDVRPCIFVYLYYI